MTTPAATRRSGGAASEVSRRRMEWAGITGLAVRLIRRGTFVVVSLVSGLSAIVVVQYTQTFANAADTASLQVLAQNPAIRVLFGVPIALNDAGGFTVWRTGTFSAVTVSAWALLTATRITRGEEQAGRWSLLLCGRSRLPIVVSYHLTVLLSAQVLVGVTLSIAMILAGTETRGALIYGAGIALVGMVFAALGTLSGQLLSDRRSAAGLATAVLGMGLLLRMVADGIDQLRWLRWLTPFGLLAHAEPYASNRLAPLLVLAAAGAAAATASVGAAGRRDLESGLIATRGARPPRIRLLRSVPAFAIRRTLSAFIGWAVGLSAYFLLIGLLAVSLTNFLIANPRFAELAGQAGFSDLATVQGYAAALFSLLGIPLGLFAASRLNLDATDEADGRLTLLFSRTLVRSSWAIAQVGVVATACILLAGTAGLAVWIGTNAVGAQLRLDEALAGTLNVVPVGLLCLGAAQFAIGWVPRAVLPIGATPAVGGFVLLVLADTFGWPHWIPDLSPFSHVASVPATSADWPGTAGILAVAVLLTVVGIAGFARRDLRG